MSDNDKMCVIYKMYDSQGNPLRFGHTSQNPPEKRIDDYKRKRWWNQVKKIKKSEPSECDMIRLQEREAIREECPRYNKKSAELCKKRKGLNK